MFEKTSVSATQTFVYKNRYNTTEIEDINNGNLAFAFYAYNIVNLTVLDETVGTFRLQQVTKNGYEYAEGTPIQEVNVTEVELENCHPESKIFKTNWNESFRHYFCPKFDHLSIAGDSFSNIYHSFSLSFEK
jgi:hypothetical protein